MPASDSLLLLGDFSARVGAGYSSWPFALDHFGIGSQNSSGQRLLELGAQHNLCVTNSFFPGHVHYKVSLQCPRSKRWHQLDGLDGSADYVVDCAFYSADCDSDHSLYAAYLGSVLK